jgi:hypothetical protein
MPGTEHERKKPATIKELPPGELAIPCEVEVHKQDDRWSGYYSGNPDLRQLPPPCNAVVELGGEAYNIRLENYADIAGMWMGRFTGYGDPPPEAVGASE